jgi:hypothetical protein
MKRLQKEHHYYKKELQKGPKPYDSPSGEE